MKVIKSASYWHIKAVWDLLSQADIIISTMKGNIELARALSTLDAKVFFVEGPTDSIQDFESLLDFDREYLNGQIADHVISEYQRGDALYGVDEPKGFTLVHYHDLRKAAVTAVGEKIRGMGAGSGVDLDRALLDTDFIVNYGLSHYHYELRHGMPAVVLKSGLKVYNFSSGHGFQFEDGAYLQPCNSARVNGLSAVKDVIVHDRTVNAIPARYQPKFESVTPVYKLTPNLIKEVKRILSDGDGEYKGDFVILVPFPIHQAIRQFFGWNDEDFKHYPFRVILQGKRAQDNGHPEIKTDQFCW